MNVTDLMLADWMLPKGASNLAPAVDYGWNLILWVTGFFFFIVVGAMTLFVIKYRRRSPSDVTPEITHNTPLEIVWTFVPLIIVMYFFYEGFRGFIHYDTPESGAVPIVVEGQKWKFTFFYANGAQDGDLYLLKDQAVRLDMHAKDVLHALYLPTFRTQRNLIPNRLTQIWFIPTELSPKEGWPIFCTQYCGDGHSRMYARVHVLEKAAYDERMKELANPFKKKMPDGKQRWVPFDRLGETLYKQNCISCHSTDGKDGTGPTWKGFWTRDHEFYFPAGTSPLKGSASDEEKSAYITESVLKPEAKLVTHNGRAFSGMSPFASQFSGSEANNEKLRAIIEFIKKDGDEKRFVDPNDDKYDAEKHPDIHPDFLRAREAATQTRPGQ